MPLPSPSKRHELRSSAVACARRGYQASGTAMVRPSLRSTVSVSSVTATCVAKTVWVSTAEELIPTLLQLFAMLLDQLPKSVEILAPEAATAFQTDGTEPKLCLTAVAFHVNVGRLPSIPGIEE